MSDGKQVTVMPPRAPRLPKDASISLGHASEAAVHLHDDYENGTRARAVRHAGAFLAALHYTFLRIFSPDALPGFEKSRLGLRADGATGDLGNGHSAPVAGGCLFKSRYPQAWPGPTFDIDPTRCGNDGTAKQRNTGSLNFPAGKTQVARRRDA